MDLLSMPLLSMTRWYIFNFNDSKMRDNIWAPRQICAYRRGGHTRPPHHRKSLLCHIFTYMILFPHKYWICPGGAPFDILQLCRRSSTFLKLQSVGEIGWSSSKNFDMGNVFIAKKFETYKILSKKFDIYSKIFLPGCWKIFLTPGWIGPVSPDADVKLLCQLFLQCMCN